MREARAAAQLRSDHVVSIFQVGEADNVGFLAMEFLEGTSLEDWLKQGQPPTFAQVARIGRQIALGLAAAHERGLIHRDVKPANVWLESAHQGRAKLLDFGLAHSRANDPHLTQSGTIVGTPAYMALEQARGEKIDHRADLFSLGVVLYRLCTGRMPFRGENTTAVLTSLAVDQPRPPREVNPAVPPRLAALIARLLAKDREKRPGSAQEVADELLAIERAAAGQGEGGPPRWRNRLRVAAGLLLLLGGLAAEIVVIIRNRDGKEVARVNVPKGGSAEVKDDPRRQPLPQGGKSEPVPRPVLLPGEPLSPTALVQRPARLPGVRSWTIALRSIEAAAWVSSSAVAYRPDGKRLAVGSGDGSIRIWEPHSGRLVQLLYAPNEVWRLAWSPDGRVLAAIVRWDKRAVYLWDAETARFLRSLETPPEVGADRYGWSVSWSLDGQKVLAATKGWILAWNAANGSLVDKILTNTNYWPAFSPDGKHLAGSITDCDGLVIWDIEAGRELHRFAGCGLSPAVCWSPDGKRLACTGSKGLYVLDAASGKEIHHNKDLHFVSDWSPDSRAVVGAADSGRNAWILELADNKQLRHLEDGGEGFLNWSPDGKVLARIRERDTVCLYDAATGKRLRTLSEGNQPRSFYCRLSPDGQTVATIIDQQTVLSSLDTGRIIAVLKDAGGWALDWSPNGKSLATTGPGHALLVWSADGKTRRALVGHKDKVNSVAWSPDGKTLASLGFDKRLLLWDVESGERRREWGPFHAKPDWVRWSPDGRYIVFHEESVGWMLWDVRRNKLANDPKQWAVNVFLLAPDGRSALTALHSGSPCRLRDLATGKDIGAPSPACIWTEATPSWSADGRLFAVGRDTTVELWRGNLRWRVRTLKATQAVQGVAFSANGKLVAGLSRERLHLWEADTGRLRGILVLGETNNGLTITPDGRYSGNEKVDRGIVMVVQKDDGTQEVLEPFDFEKKYGWKNDPGKVHLLRPLPPPLSPQPGMPMGPHALVREPAELPHANSWTIETVNARGQVKAVAYRPDGKLLATGGEDGSIRIWDPVYGKLVRLLIGDPVESLSWSKDGKVLIAGDPKAGREWDVDTGRTLRRIAGIDKPGIKEARSPDGKQTAKIEPKGVHLYDAGGKRTHVLEESEHVIFYNLTWSPDGRSLSYAYSISDGDAGLRIVDAATGRRTPGLTEYERAGVWSPDGKFLAAFGRDQGVYLLDAVSQRVLRKLEGELDGGTTLVWSADGKRLAGGYLRAIIVWSVETGKRLWRDDKRASGVAWSLDGRRVASTDNDKKVVRIWEAETGKLRHEYPLHAESGLAWSPDGKTLLVGAMYQDEAVLIDGDSGAARLKLKGGVRGATGLRWSSDGKSVATLSNQGLLRVWDAANGQPKRTRHFPGVSGHIAAATWSSDGRELAWASGTAVHLHDSAGQPLGVVLPLDTFGALAVTPDGHYRGNARVERAIRMVVQKRDGTSETLTPAEFEKKYHFRNDPDKVRLLDQ